MPYTVGGAFDGFYEKINLVGDHREIANSRRDAVVEILKKSLTVLDAVTTGSIPRFTALRSVADLDLLVALHYGRHIKDQKPSAVLQAVRDALGEYRVNVRKNGQAVTMYYKTWPNVDIVPAARVTNADGTISHYEIPDMTRETWLRSNPPKHSSTIEARSSLCGTNFRKVIKMAKAWSRGHGDLLQSYHIEAMAVAAFTSTMSDITWDSFFMLDKMAGLVSGPFWYEDAFIDGYLNAAARADALSRLERARDTARSAWYATYGGNSDHKTAITLWREVFGDDFPPYG